MRPTLTEVQHSGEGDSRGRPTVGEAQHDAWRGYMSVAELSRTSVGSVEGAHECSRVGPNLSASRGGVPEWGYMSIAEVGRTSIRSVEGLS